MNKVNRRDFLSRLSKLGIFLPVLEAVPRLRAQENNTKAKGKPINLVCISVNLGHYLPNFNPKVEGVNYPATPCLKTLKKYRLPNTVISGAWNNIHRAHGSAACVWTGIDPAPGNKWRGHSISLDQFIANLRFGETFLPYFNIVSGETSFNKRGVAIKGHKDPKSAMNSVFKPINKRSAKEEYSTTKNMLNILRKDIKSFRKNLSVSDNLRIDDYMDSLDVISRGEDERLNWVNNYKLPKKPPLSSFDPFYKKYKSKYLASNALNLETIKLVLAANLTRVATTTFRGGNVFVDLPGVKAGWHDNTHHGGRNDRKKELYKIDVAVASLVADFAKSLQDTTTSDGKTLLDNTLILYSSGLGDANTHATQHLPFLAIGGGLNHKGHISYLKYKDKASRPLFSSFYLEILQHLGFEIEKFGNANKKSNIWT